MLPGLDGIEVARRLRRGNNNTPVVMLTARDSVPDIVRGLDVGADDYLIKPFSFVELLPPPVCCPGEAPFRPVQMAGGRPSARSAIRTRFPRENEPSYLSRDRISPSGNS